MLIDIGDSLRIWIHLIFEIFYLYQLIINFEAILINFPRKVVDLILQMCLLRLHLDLYFKHSLLNLIELSFSTFCLFVVDRHFQEVDPVIKFLIFFFKM